MAATATDDGFRYTKLYCPTDSSHKYREMRPTCLSRCGDSLASHAIRFISSARKLNAVGGLMCHASVRRN